MFYPLFKHLIFRPVIKLLYRGELHGEENIPATGGVLLASNHISSGDTVVLPALIQRQLTFPAKAELFVGNRGLLSKLIAWFLKAVGQVPLDRSGGRQSLHGLGPVLEVLANGGAVGIYPEGTRSPDGRLYKGKTGVARMALTAGVPVIPVAVLDTEIVKLGPLPWMRRPQVFIGKPLDFSAYANQVDDRRTLRWVTDEVMNAIMELSGQTYLEAYGTSVKGGSLSTEEADARIRSRPGTGTPPPILAAPSVE